MIRTFAYECYADEDVSIFLKNDCGLPIKGRHSYSQGEVINDLLIRDRAVIGMVDEDPGKSHHHRREAMNVITTTNDLELREENNHHLIIVKPALEECFLRSMRRAKLTSELPGRLAMLNIPDHPAHEVFRQELRNLYQQSKVQKIGTFVTEIEVILRRLFNL